MRTRLLSLAAVSTWWLVAGCASERRAPPPSSPTTVRLIPLTEDELRRAAAARQGITSVALPYPGVGHGAPSEPAPLTTSHPLNTRTLAAPNGSNELRIAPTPALPSATVDQWASRYPDAARELGALVRRHPEGARRLFAWNASDPEQVQVLGDWAITHPYESLNAFLISRRTWGALQEILEDHYGAAVEELVLWCRNAPMAATELLHHPRGLAWVGEHVYQASSRGARARGEISRGGAATTRTR